MNDFAGRLLAWYDDNGRKDLPWQTKDPYRVWVSEIMLQQTQVQTVIPYFERFVERFPDIESLAGAPVDDVLRNWSGLGYYARARNLHQAARIVVTSHDGRLPDDLESLVDLPGIGRSTAGAILSLAFGQRQAILDGNVKRVLSRYAAVDGWPGKSSVLHRLWDLAEQYTPAERVDDYTQAIMDLGATVCKRSRPACEDCPFEADCQAHAMHNVIDYPGRKPKKSKPCRETTMVLAVADGAVYLERRPPEGVWGGLWSLPEINGSRPDAWCEQSIGATAHAAQNWPALRHSFTHFDLDIRPVVVYLDHAPAGIADAGDAVWYRLEDEAPGGIAAPVQSLLDTLRETNDVSNR